MKYQIANEAFLAKNNINARCQAIIAATPNGQTIGEADAQLLFEIFQFHDEWVEKSAGGVVTISTQSTPHGTRCFVLRTISGESIDISFRTAVRLIPTARSTTLLPQALLDFRNAAHEAVKTQIFDFRDSALRLEQNCPITSETLNRLICAVDHTPPKTFDQLLFDFCTCRSVDPLVVAVGSLGGTVAILEDTDLRTAWQLYHQLNAKLRLLSRIGNLQLKKIVVPWRQLFA